jgi:hypothetical protein
MREPELVFKAQLAAAALERAWERWRAIHGMIADPMPAISSYVGYSLEEPWGQPRVVFGLSAEDAEQLVTLLDRHDCIGPVHKTIAAEQGGRELPAQASHHPADRLVSVPRQAPSLDAESQAADAGRGLAFIGQADQEIEQDGPVFRQLVAAARNTAGARIAVHAGPAPDAGDAGAGAGVVDVDAYRGETVAADSGTRDVRSSGAELGGASGADGQEVAHVAEETPSWSQNGAATDTEPAADADSPAADADSPAADADSPAVDDSPLANTNSAVADADLTDTARADSADADHTADQPVSGHPRSADHASDAGDSHDGDQIRGDVPAASSGAASGGESAGETGPATPPETAREGEIAEDADAVPASDTVAPAGLVPGDGKAQDTAPADVDSARPNPSANGEPEELADGPGPLAQAASTAKVEAEARIRAAQNQGIVSEPSASEAGATGPQDAGPGDAATKPAKSPTTQESAARPDAAPVARPETAEEPVHAEVQAADRGHPDDVASSASAEAAADDIGGPTIGAFGFGSDLADFVGSYQESGKRSDQSRDHASSGYARRSRSRSYSIPRLSKAKRSGAIPGA